MKAGKHLMGVCILDRTNLTKEENKLTISLLSLNRTVQTPKMAFRNNSSTNTNKTKKTPTTPTSFNSPVLVLTDSEGSTVS
jgi:hypothetical protein